MSFVVFSVENGDRLVLCGPRIAGQPTLKAIALSFISTPKQAKRIASGDFGSEEPCAHEAAELIRAKFIGKQVKFVEDYYIDALRRSAGRLTLVNGGEDASALLLQAGLATVPERIPPRMTKSLFATYTQWMQQAKAARRGLFAPDAARHVRQMHNLTTEQLAKLTSALTGKVLSACIERALSPTALIISAKELGETQIAVHMSGITTARKDLSCSEEMLAEARFHTERSLQNRIVQVRLDGVDGCGNVLVSLLSSRSSFQEELLLQGLAVLHAPTLTFCPRASELQAAEATAQQNRKGLWKSLSSTTATTATAAGATAHASNATPRQDTSSPEQGHLRQNDSHNSASNAVQEGNDAILSGTHTAATDALARAKTTTMSSLADSLRRKEQNKAEDESSGVSAVTLVRAGAAPVTTIAGTSAAGAMPAAPVCIPTYKSDGSEGPSYTGPIHFTGVLIQVLHGDTLVIREDDSDEPIRVTLSGARTSKDIVREQDGKAAEARVTYRNLAWEAKEYVRTHFILRRVTVTVESARVMPETNEIRPSAAVTIPAMGVDLALALLERGLATFYLGKHDRCAAAASLQAAEARAIQSKKGVHVGQDKLPSPVRIIELSHLGESRARYYLSFLQRGMQQSNRPPVLPGVVELVVGPTSLRVYLPKENFQVPIRVAGVIAPNVAFNPHDQADPFAKEAKNVMIDLIQQREVDVQVYGSDRVGNFVASVTVRKSGRNAAVALVEAGLATVGNAEKLPFHQQLLEAQASAQRAKLYIWSGENKRPQRSVRREAEQAAANPQSWRLICPEESQRESKANFVDGTNGDSNGSASHDHDDGSANGVSNHHNNSDNGHHHNQNKNSDSSTHVEEKNGYHPYIFMEAGEDGTSVYLQPHDAATAERQATVQNLLDRIGDRAADGKFVPRRNDMVVALYGPDKTWCRARVRAVQPDTHAAEVFFVDYGNVELVKLRNVRVMTRTAEFALLHDLPPLVTHARLAFLTNKVPSQNHIAAACNVMHEYADSESVWWARAVYCDGTGTRFYNVTLSPALENGTCAAARSHSLGETLLEAGLAILDKRARNFEAPEVKGHVAAQDVARRCHKGLWQYGDVDEDDNDNNY